MSFGDRCLLEISQRYVVFEHSAFGGGEHGTSRSRVQEKNTYHLMFH